METISLKINGVQYDVPKGSTVLEAARAANIDIPTLCYLKDINEIGACRLCLVEVSEGGRPFRMVTACVYPATEGMEILTNTPKINKSRKTNLELLLSKHDRKCLSCVRSTTCELQKLCLEYGVDETRFEGIKNHYEVDTSTPIIRDNNKCILCRRCVAACKTVQGIGVIGANDRGFDTHIGSAFEQNLGETSCVNCGQCIVACPVGALYESVTTIGAEIFYNTDGVTKVIFPDTVTSLGTGIFRNADGIKEVKFPEGLKELGNNMFGGATGIEEIVIPDSVQKIGDQFFYKCNALKNIYFGKNLNTLGGYIFYKCTAASTVNIHYPGTEKDWDDFMLIDDGEKEGEKNDAAAIKARVIFNSAYVAPQA